MKTAFQIVRVIHCAEVHALHARGLYGFHDSPSCPNCQKIPDGTHVHDGDLILAPFVGYHADADTVVSPHPVYITR